MSEMDSEDNQPGLPPDQAIPQAIIRTPDQVASRRLTTRLWWLTGVCLLVAVGLVVSSFRSQGTLISIHFDDGHGLKAGDTLRYRGIDIGTVKTIGIAEDLTGVRVGVLLVPGNERVAVEGSQFWVERARLRMGQAADRLARVSLRTVRLRFPAHSPPRPCCRASVDSPKPRRSNRTGFVGELHSERCPQSS